MRDFTRQTVTRQHWTAADDARFFDCIADGWTIGAAARAVYRTRGAGQGRFARVRQAYGWQGQ